MKEIKNPTIDEFIGFLDKLSEKYGENAEIIGTFRASSASCFTGKGVSTWTLHLEKLKELWN